MRAGRSSNSSSSAGNRCWAKHHPQQQFPLLFKFLDCQRNLSVQVHPNDAQGAELDPPDLGKTEAWVIVGAEPGSCLYAGLKRGFDRDAFERELTRGTAELCLHKVQPQVGDCIFIPAGTVHALGQGLLVAEIQQSSNTTFRLFDWNRVGADGKPRELHLERGLAVTDFERGPVQPQIPESTEQVHVRRIVECDKFVMDRLTIDQSRPIGGDGGCHILAVVDGSANVEGDVSGQPLAFGQTMLVPASCGEIVLSPTDASAVILDMYLP